MALRFYKVPQVQSIASAPSQDKDVLDAPSQSPGVSVPLPPAAPVPTGESVLQALSKWADQPGAGLMIRNRKSGSMYTVVGFDSTDRMVTLDNGASKSKLKVRFTEREDPLYEAVWR